MKKLNLSAGNYIEALKAMGHASNREAVNITKGEGKEFETWNPFLMKFKEEDEFLLIYRNKGINETIKAETTDELIREIRNCLGKDKDNKEAEKEIKRIARGILLANKDNYMDWVREESAKYIGGCIVVKVKARQAFLWASDGDKGTENYYTSEVEKTHVIMRAEELFERAELGKSQDGEYVKYEESKEINEFTEEDVLNKLNLDKSSIISIERIE